MKRRIVGKYQDVSQNLQDVSCRYLTFRDMGITELTILFTRNISQNLQDVSCRYLTFCDMGNSLLNLHAAFCESFHDHICGRSLLNELVMN
jgi:hypothetical protein